MSAIMSERRQLINLTYRLLGSLAEAEDAVQETYARWYALSRPQQDAIETPGAWLTTVASRICLDLLRSARARRERHVGEWIPEPPPDPAGQPRGPPSGAAPRPVEGGEQIARYMGDLASRAPGNLRFLERTVNGQPGLVAQQDGVTVAVYAFDIVGDRIKHIWAILNPDKLRPWTTS